MRTATVAQNSAEPTLAEKVGFLSRPETYGQRAGAVTCRETHMSWVFLTSNRVYKLKKPVRFPYLDFSTLALREAACRAELRLNRRLAPDVYIEVAALTSSDQGLSIGGPGKVVDWLVVMRRLDERHTLERALAERRVAPWQLDRLVATLTQFYRHARPVARDPAAYLDNWRRDLAQNRSVLLDARLDLPAGLVHFVDGMQRRFLDRRPQAIANRLLDHRIVDAHGDLRPEHIWLEKPAKIIDCLEFNPRLRAIDPLDEIAYLTLECERLGDAWTGRYIKRRMLRVLGDDPPDDLFAFYRCHRATLRARLAIAHLLEPRPRTPEKWPRLARTYLQLAASDARTLARALKPRPSFFSPNAPCATARHRLPAVTD